MGKLISWNTNKIFLLVVLVASSLGLTIIPFLTVMSWVRYPYTDHILLFWLIVERDRPPGGFSG